MNCLPEVPESASGDVFQSRVEALESEVAELKQRLILVSSLEKGNVRTLRIGIVGLGYCAEGPGWY